MYKKRNLYRIIKKRISEKQPLVQVIIGPRQVGKTTALKQAIGSNALYLSADGPIPPSYRDIENWWKKTTTSKHKVLAIDEVQKIPDWSEIIKKLWDNDQSIKVILTGSSSILMEKGFTESLAGRYELIQAEHWNFFETRKIFGLSLYEYISFGCYPGSIRFLDNKIRWSDFIKNSIIEPVISKDLLQLSPVKSPALLRQLFLVACAYPAQIISLTKLLGELNEKGSVPTLKNYMKLLSDSFLVSTIEKYSTRKLRTKVSIPKIIVHDNSLIRSFEKPVGQKLSAKRFGRYFENSIAARFIEAGYETYYWKERSIEVDLVIIGPENQKWAIEVKSTKTNLKSLSGLFYFCKKFPEFTPKLISLENQKIDGIETIPILEVLELYRKY